MFYRTSRLAAATALALLAGGAAGAQGLADPNAIDTIVGSEVVEEDGKVISEAGKVISAIDRTVENTEKVRKTSALDKLDIVYLPEAAADEGGPPPEIEKKIAERSDEIADLRQEIEGNAMLYHALDSRQILVRDVLALEFDDRNGVIIYAAAKSAN